MKKIAVLTNEQVDEFRVFYERKQSIDDLCRSLAWNNETFHRNESDFYERLVQDNLECLKYLQNFWNECQKKYNVNLQPTEEMYIDFFTNELGVREIIS